MIRKRRGERMENVIGEGDVPIFIAKEGVKLAHGRLLSLIAPSELAVLQMDFLEIAILEGIAKAANSTTMNRPSTFITSLVDLVEVSCNQPPGVCRWFLIHKLGEELLLEIAAVRSIDNCQFERDIGPMTSTMPDREKVIWGGPIFSLSTSMDGG